MTAVIFDAGAVFGALTNNKNAFASIEADLRKQARQLLEKGMKAKSFGLNEMRELGETLGASQLALCLDAFAMGTVQSVVKKLDPHNVACKGAKGGIDAEWARRRILELARGSEPAEKPVALDKLLPVKMRTPEHVAGALKTLGPERFRASLEAMSAAAPKSMVKKLDPTNPRAKGPAGGIDAAWARKRIAEIAGDASLAAIPLERPADAKASKKRDEEDWYDRADRVYSAAW